MNKELKYFTLGVLATFAGTVVAQSPTIFNLLRVNTQSDLRGEIINSTGNVTVNDGFVVNAGGGPAELTVSTDLVALGSRLLTIASATGGAGFNVPEGTAPSAPVNGDMWTTSGGLFARINGVTEGPYDYGGVPDFPILAPDGLASAPSYSFASHPDAGMTMLGTDYLTLSVDGGFTNGGAELILEGPHAALQSSALGEMDISGDSVVRITTAGAIEMTSPSPMLFTSPQLDALGTVANFDEVTTVGAATFGGLVTTPASAAASAGLTLPHGAAPTVPANGNLWTTTGGLFARINGVTQGPFTGTTTPGGSDTQVQYNDGGAFGGDAGMVFNETTDALTLLGPINVGGRGTFSLATGNADPSITVANANPTFQFNETDGAADNRLWTHVVRSEQYRQCVLSDAFVETCYLLVDRTGSSVDTLTLFTTNLSLNLATTANVATLGGNNTDSVMSISTGGGGTAGDSVVRWNNSGNIAWTMGVDRSAGTTLRMTPAATIDGTTSYFIMTTAGALRLAGYGAGTATFDASGNITSVSDERMKRDIRPFTRGLSAINELDPILYGYTPESELDQTRNDYAGFSAQNVREFIPEAVDGDEALSLSDRPVIAALVNAVQELSRRIEELERQ